MREPATTTGDLPQPLKADVERAGYYPELICDVIDTALGGEQVRSFLVHPETTFDREEVRRHVTVLVLTDTRLLVTHADDHEPDELSPEPYASASTEIVALQHLRAMVISQAVVRPADHRRGDTPREMTLSIGWGAVQRVDMEPAACADPNCEADHGYSGSITSDDITLRLSIDAEGKEAVRAAAGFMRELSAGVAAAGGPRR